MHKYVNFIFFTDEKLFTIARPSNSQNDRVYDGINKVKKGVDCRHLPQSSNAPDLLLFSDGFRLNFSSWTHVNAGCGSRSKSKCWG